MAHIEYIATDSTHQTIPWVSKTNDDGTTTEFVSTDQKEQVTGQKRAMDCIDCHNRAAHSFTTPEEALNRAMAQGSPSAALPFVHKEGLALLKATYASQEEARAKIASGLDTYYQSQYPAVWNGQRAQIDQAASTLATIYDNNVFPFMKVTWGTHPNNIGHNDYPGCFRCHDGSHNSKVGASISNDCSLCHNLLVSGEANPKLLTDLGIQ
jgi:formate-dependent nitrite reductase cytochrome c552 subunit